MQPRIRRATRPDRTGIVALVALAVLFDWIPMRTEHDDRSEAAAASSACETVLVSIDWDRSRAEKVSGVVVRIGFPHGLEIAADASSRSAKESVEVLSGTSDGLFDAIPRDSDGDGAVDLLNVGLIRPGIASGPFARIRFACPPGASRPKASDFSCRSDIADESGSVPSSCRVTLGAS